MPGGKVLKSYSYEGGVVREQMLLSVREARVFDAERILAMTREAYANRREADPPYKALFESADDVTRQLETGGAVVATLAEMEGDRIVGAIRWRKEDGGVLLGYRFAVDPAFQRRGIGGQLLERLERVARIEEAREIHLHVRASETGLMEMYAKFGYVLDETSEEGEYAHPAYKVMSKKVEARRAF